MSTPLGDGTACHTPSLTMTFPVHPRVWSPSPAHCEQLRRLSKAWAACSSGCVYVYVCVHTCLCRTLVERVIGARLVYRQPNMSRLISFEYLNRQLVWQELSEFLLFLLPLINVAKVGTVGARRAMGVQEAWPAGRGQSA